MNYTNYEKKYIQGFKRDILPIFPQKMLTIFNKIPEEKINDIEEIRLRASKPLMIFLNGKDYFISKNFLLTTKIEDSIYIEREDIDKTLQIMCDYSLYAIEDELRQGFITLKGGHRVGLTGRSVIDNGKIKTLKYVTGMNIRIAKEVEGCSNNLVKQLFSQGIRHTIIASPPGCGKTTLLRDIIRNLSNGMPEYQIRGYKVCIVDERSEIAGCYLGVPQRNIGVRTDVLDACPKAQGMLMLLRSMSPEIIAVDEIGSLQDADSIEDAVNSGVKVIATVHGRDIDEMQKRPGVRELMQKHAFEYAVILSRKNGPGTIDKIIDL